MDIDSSEQRNYLNFAEYHLVLVRGLMRQWGIDKDRAHLMAGSRFPMSSHTAIDEIAVRGLRVTLADVEEFWFELHNQLCDCDRLQWSAKAVENFIQWAVAKNRAVPIVERTPYIEKFLRDREFVAVAREFALEIEKSINVTELN